MHYVDILAVTPNNIEECYAFISGTDNEHWVNLHKAKGLLLVKEKNSIRYEDIGNLDKHYVVVN